MMRFVRENVREHGRARRPLRRPTAAREFCDAPFRIVRQSIFQHTQTLSRTFLVRCGGLPDRAAGGVERRRTLKVRRRVPDPRKTAVVQVRENRGDGAAVSFFSGRLRPPGARIEAGEDKLIYRVVDCIGLD